jgi:hypothetical protein
VLRLVTLVISVGCLAAFVWFGVTVELGDHTLFGHLRNIGQSKESQELWRGTKTKVNDVLGLEAARAAARAKAGKGAAPGEKPAPGQDGEDRPAAKTAPAGPPQEDLTPSDRDAMKKLIGSAQAHAQARKSK